MTQPTVCAVLVTHNRAPLLREALAALENQTRRANAILVVDNASTDDTRAVLEEFPLVQVLRLKENLGSSGGYYAGIQRAFADGFDWIWTLDDDSICQPDALAALLESHDSFPPLLAPKLLASKVVWTDGSLHAMNIQKPKLYDADRQFLAAGHATMSVRFTSFVSMLIHRGMIEQHGLPIPGYFMWNDDVEFSARILKQEFGVLVPASIVCHKTAAKHVPSTSVGSKYYFEVRNKLWILRHSKAFARDEKWWMAKSLARRTWRYLVENQFGRESVLAVAHGVFDGIRGKTAGWHNLTPMKAEPTIRICRHEAA